MQARPSRVLELSPRPFATRVTVNPSFVIVGAGIAGLSAAWELARTVDPTQIFILEASDRTGGVLQSLPREGFLLEEGADSFLTAKPAATQLARELGLGDQLSGSRDQQRKTFIYQAGRMWDLPEGWRMVAPARVSPILGTGLLPWSERLATAARMTGLFPTPPPASEEESVATLVRRHCGEASLRRIAAPLLSGVYGGDPESLSATWTVPRLAQAAQESRLWKLLRQPVAAGSDSTFTTLGDGMGSLAAALTSALLAKGVNLELGCPVQEVVPQPQGGFRLKLPTGGGYSAESLVVALPAPRAASLFAASVPTVAHALRQIRYGSSVTVNLAFRPAPQLPQGFGFLVPATRENRALRLRACTFAHRKFDHRAPEGDALLRVFYGGMLDPEVLRLPDIEIVNLAREELRQTCGIGATPNFTTVHRWREALAQYEVGHGARLQVIATALAPFPRLRLAGNAYQGIGVPDCIENGARAARELLAG